MLAPHRLARLKSPAQKPACPNHQQQRTAFELHNGRSALAARTGPYIGGNAAALQGDTTNLADLDRIYATVEAQAGRIDVLCGERRGLRIRARSGRSPRSISTETFNTNVRGLLFTVQKALPLLAKGSSVILDRLDGVDQGLRRLLGLQRDKGRDTLVRARLDRRPQGARHPGQRVEPRLHRRPPASAQF